MLQREHVDRAHAYSPHQEAAEAAAEQMKTVLESGDDRTAVLHCFAQILDPADEAALLVLLGPGAPGGTHARYGVPSANASW
ncbi:hypothetical protein [Streptomyces silvisoli]|uniref:hypothetical protein n=1 Tax=Streptomyces silvisoli TaxID=3034235 RepID=UPI003703C35F